MTGFFIIVVSSIGGAIGWWLGDLVGFWAACFLSLVGSAVGVYFGRKLARHYLP